MAATVFVGILVLLGLAGLIGAFVGISPEYKYGRIWTGIASVLVIIIAPVALILSGFTYVPTKSVGVVTSFGKVGTEYGPGSHWLAPWRSLSIIQDTIQSDNFFQANGQGPDQETARGINGYCIPVRLAGLSQGCLDVQLQTQVVPAAIPELYANYSSYGPNLTLEVDQYVVQRELKTALNRPPLSDYNVIQDVSASLTACITAGQNNCTANASSQFSQFDPVILQELRNDPQLKGKIDVLDVNLQTPHFDDNTEAAITKIQTAYLTTVEATQQEKTNAAISLANKALVQSNSLSAAVLQNECYTTTQQAIKAGYQLPTGWNCSGQNASMILNGK